MSEAAFTIIYGRGRFPIQQKREDGSLGCRGCGAVIPKGYRTWCSRDCRRIFDPGEVLRAVRARDKDVCCVCSYDCPKARAEWVRECHAARIPTDSFRARTLVRFHKPNYDHIVPFSEGGLTVLENMRTLCEPCHKQRTKQWHKERAASKRHGVSRRDAVSLDLFTPPPSPPSGSPDSTACPP